MSKEPRLRGRARRHNSPYPLGEIPHSVAVEIGKHIVHRIAIGHADITGDDFGGIFARAISGEHRARPLGIADVIWNGCAWSVKTVKDNHPFTKRIVRIISGRNSPVYSSAINDPFADIQATGRSILRVWNARVDEAAAEHDDVRVFVMIRNMSTLEFTLFEFEATRFVPTNYEWRLNKDNNFEAYDIQSGAHRFTWQPHGAQFTIKHSVPASAYKFRINRTPTIIEERHVLQLTKFKDDWIEPVESPE
jgi:hypothetical protein